MLSININSTKIFNNLNWQFDYYCEVFNLFDKNVFKLKKIILNTTIKI